MSDPHLSIVSAPVPGPSVPDAVASEPPAATAAPPLPRAIHMRFHDRDNSGGGGGGGGTAVAPARVSFSSSSSSPSAAHRARLEKAAASAAAAAAASSSSHGHHGASSFSLSTGTRTRSSTEDSPLVRPRFHSDAEEGGMDGNGGSAAFHALQMLSNVTRAGSHRHAAVLATNPAADVPASASSHTAAHDNRHSVSSTQMPAWHLPSGLDSPTAAAPESKEQSEATFVLGAAATSASITPSSPKRLPLHFHSKLPSSAHNPLVMLDKFRSASGAGAAVVGLDEDEIKLEDASAGAVAVAASDGQPLSPRSLAELPDSVTAHLPIPIGPPTAHFTQSSWSWKHIDYVETHLPLLADFFSAIETHSEAFVDRIHNPPPAAVVPPVMLSARRASLEKLPPLPPVRSSPAKDVAAASSVAGSPPLRPASASSLLASLTPLQSLASSSSSDGSSGSASPRPLPSYPPHFVPHRLASLQMHARKELLRKTKVVTSAENGPGLIERNPSEQMLAFVFAASGTMPTSAASSGAHTARGHSSAYYSSNAAAASAAASLLSAASAASSTPALPPPSGLNVIPHLTSLDFRMGISGELLAESLKRNQTLTQLGLSHNVISLKGCNALCRNLQSHPQLRIMDLSHNILYPDSAPALRDLLLYNRTLSSLDLAINKLGAVGVSTLMEALGASKPNMRAIKLAVERALAPVSAVHLSSSPPPSQPNSARLASSPLSFNSASSAASSNAQSASGAATPSASPPASAGPAGSLNASPNPPASSAAASASASGASSTASTGAAGSLSNFLSLMPAFSINQTLTSLNLANNKLGPEIESVASALCCSNSALRELNLSLNDIGDTGANFLAFALRHPNCTTLRSLNLGDNLIGPMGVKVLCQALELNHTLHTLNLSWNSLGQSGLGEGPRAVGRLLASNTTLRELVLQSNCISDGGLKAICAGWMESLERQAAAAVASGANAAPVRVSSLQLLDLSVNPLGDSGVRDLSSILSHPHCPLRTLLLNRCQLSEDGCAALIAAIPLNHRLMRLSLQGNAALKASTVAHLIDTYARSKTLLELDVEDSPHITRDDALAAMYRRARTHTFAHTVATGSGMPHELSAIVAEYILDLRHKSAIHAAHAE